MGVYHITYTPELKEICLYFDGGCDFSCYGCITDWHPDDCHLAKNTRAPEHQSTREKIKTLSIKKVISYLKPIPFEKVIFLGKEPTQDRDFLPLAKILKKDFATYHVLLTNGYRYVAQNIIDEVCISIKAVSKKIFQDFTGKNNPQPVLENFKRYVNTSCLKVRSESVFIPGLIDIDEIEKIAQFIAKIDSSIPYRIDAYIPHREDKFRRPDEDEMEKAKTAAQEYLKNVSNLHSEVKVKYGAKRIY